MHIDEDVSSLENVVFRCLISRLHNIDPIACRLLVVFPSFVIENLLFSLLFALFSDSLPRYPMMIIRGQCMNLTVDSLPRNSWDNSKLKKLLSPCQRRPYSRNIKTGIALLGVGHTISGT